MQAYSSVKTSILIVNYNSSDFIELSLYALKKLSRYPYKVLIGDNNSEKRDYENLISFSKKYDNIDIEKYETKLTGSIAHGTALNKLIHKVNTPYFSVLDADATWLVNGWDELLINELNEKVKAVGTQAPLKKAQNFPLMFAILFETETFRKLDIDFRPKKGNHRLDTGWELSEKYLNAGFTGKNLEYLNTRTYKKGPFQNIIAGEYYLNQNYNTIIASHFGRGSSLGKAKYNKSYKKIIYKIPYFGSIMLRKKGIKERNKWLKICKNIIDEQQK